MRKIISILFLIPFLGYSQFHVDIKAINLEDGSEIPYVHYKVGYEIFSADFIGRVAYGKIDTKYLEQTLEISHGNFKFEQRALYQHEYRVIGNTLYLTVYGRPWKQKQINIDLAIAKSKKVKNDTVRITYGEYDYKALLSFVPSVEIKSKKGQRIIPFKRAYDNLTDGHYVLSSDNNEVKIPFQKENWTQVVCFNQPKETQFAQRELDLLRTYFEELDAAEQLRFLREREHEAELDALQGEIDELNREIDRLKGKPVAYRPDPPEPIYEEPKAEIIFDLVNEEAEPPNGYDGFIADIEKILSNERAKYSGNVTFEIIVQKDGRIRPYILHSGSQDKLNLLKQMDEYLEGQRWSPATFEGRPIDFTVVVSLNILSQENK